MEENKKICPNCKNEIDGTSAVCPLCGHSEKQKSAVSAGASGELIHAIISGGVMLVGIIIMFAYRAWLGTPIALIGIAYGGYRLYRYSEAMGENIVETLKTGLKSDDLGIKLMTAFIYIAPILIIIGIYRWVSVDTQRQVDDMFSKFN